MGAVDGRRAARSPRFADFVASSHVPQLSVFDGVINPGIGLDSAYNPASAPDAVPPAPRGAGREHRGAQHGTVVLPGQAVGDSPNAEASVGGLDFNEDPVSITQGRMAIPHKADEFVIDAASAKELGYHVGEEIPVGWVTNAQVESGNLIQTSQYRPINKPGEARRHRGRAGLRPSSRTRTPPTASRSCCSRPP